MKIQLSLLWAGLMLSSYLPAQFFCSDTPQLFSSLGLPDAKANTFQVELRYRYNFMNTLLQGKEKVSEDYFVDSRYIKQYGLKLGYVFSNRWSAELVSNFVDQSSDYDPGLSHSWPQRHRGIGDLAVLIKYKLLDQENRNWSVGLGPEIPTGRFDLLSSFGNVRRQVYQPGSGSWDIISWTTASTQLFARSSSNLSFKGFYKFNSTNPGQENYGKAKLGNELNLEVALSEKIAIKNSSLEPRLGMQYRNLQRDELSNRQLECSGGDWLFLNGGLTFWLNEQTNIYGTYTLPIYADVNDFQNSHNYIWNVGLYRDFAFK